MSGTSTGAVHAALYTRLNVSSVTSLAPVYDEAPEGTAYPYVLVGDVVEGPFNRMGGKVGKDLTLMIHVWTDKRGYNVLHALMDAIDDLLDNFSLVVTGYTTDLLNFENGQLLREGLLRHAIMRYRLMVTET